MKSIYGVRSGKIDDADGCIAIPPKHTSERLVQLGAAGLVDAARV